MTQKEKELLSKDLCARLMYRVKCFVPVENCIMELTGKRLNYFCFHKEEWGYDYSHEFEVVLDPLNDSHNGYIVKPYLRSISSMTEEEMDRLFDILHIDKDGKDEDWIKINDVYGIKFFFPTGKWIENVAEAYDYLYSIHIDFRGLILKVLLLKLLKECII